MQPRLADHEDDAVRANTSFWVDTHNDFDGFHTKHDGFHTENDGFHTDNDVVFAQAVREHSYPERLIAPAPAYYLRTIRIVSTATDGVARTGHIGAFKSYAPVFEIHCEHKLEADYPKSPDAAASFGCHYESPGAFFI